MKIDHLKQTVLGINKRMIEKDHVPNTQRTANVSNEEKIISRHPFSNFVQKPDDIKKIYLVVKNFLSLLLFSFLFFHFFLQLMFRTLYLCTVPKS
mgnify:CR=1 FL=1